MSFWTDIRDTFTAPFRATASAGGAAVRGSIMMAKSPIKLTQDLVSGKNVAESFGKHGVRMITGSLAPVSAYEQKKLDSSPLMKAASPWIDKLTLGGMKDQQRINSFTLKTLAQDGDFSKKELGITSAAAGRQAVRVAAVYAGGAAVGSGSISAGTAISTAGAAANFAKTGNPTSLISAGSNIIGGSDLLPEGFGDYFSDAREYADQARDLYGQFRSQLPPQVSGYPLSAGKPAPAPGAQGTVGVLAAVALVGVGAYLVLKGRK